MDAKTKSALLSRCEFDQFDYGNSVYEQAETELLDRKECTCDEPELGECAYHDENYDLRFGVRFENARLLPIIRELLEVIEAQDRALADIYDDKYKYYCTDENTDYYKFIQQTRAEVAERLGRLCE